MKKENILALILFVVVLLGCTVDTKAEPTYPTEPFQIECTAYCYGEVTADGSKVRKGIMAGKPEWLGLTALMYEDMDGKPGNLLGIYEIKDTGGDDRIQNGTCVDIYNPDYNWCVEWGRKKVIIQLVNAVG